MSGSQRCVRLAYAPRTPLTAQAGWTRTEERSNFEAIPRRPAAPSCLRSGEIDTLAAFAADYDEAGARTFGCLLYSLDKRESALYWWRFAAGAGDPLAAHLLAAHHAAIGPTTEARAWRALAQMLNFTSERHIPEPLRHRTELAEGFARELPMRDEVRLFMRYPHLPRALAAQ